MLLVPLFKRAKEQIALCCSFGKERKSESHDGIASRSPTPQNIDAFKLYRNTYNKISRSAKKLYYESELCRAGCNLKATWKIIHQAINLKSKKSGSQIKSILINNIETTSPKLIAEYLNRFFASAPTLIVNDICKVNSVSANSNNPNIPLFKLSDRAVTAQEIIETVKLLESKSSMDMNGLSMMLIKNCIWSLATPLAHVFNNSFVNGTVPSQFKVSKVIPVFKGGDPRMADNCRPISLINNIAKILEKIMGLRLASFLDHPSLISSSQFGFRKSHSTIHPIVQFQNFVTKLSTTGNMLWRFSVI